jgi:hypothetical protein
MLTDNQIRQAALQAYRTHGRQRMPLPMLVTCVLIECKVRPKKYRDAFLQIHTFIRNNWGNNGIFHRRRGVEKGGIAIRKRVQL